VDGSRFVPACPFVTAIRGANRKEPGVEWRPGVNKVSAHWCKKSRKPPKKGRAAPVHPLPDCRCGIRAVRSRTVLDRFAEQMEDRLGARGAVAQVEVWGRVAGYAADDDWRYTLRAQYAQITGPLTLAPDHHDQREAVARRYRVEVELW
jgi:hypothetical protein